MDGIVLIAGRLLSTPAFLTESSCSKGGESASLEMHSASMLRHVDSESPSRSPMRENYDTPRPNLDVMDDGVRPKPQLATTTTSALGKGKSDAEAEKSSQRLSPKKQSSLSTLTQTVSRKLSLSPTRPTDLRRSWSGASSSAKVESSPESDGPSAVQAPGVTAAEKPHKGVRATAAQTAKWLKAKVGNTRKLLSAKDAQNGLSRTQSSGSSRSSVHSSARLSTRASEAETVVNVANATVSESVSLDSPSSVEKMLRSHNSWVKSKASSAKSLVQRMAATNEVRPLPADRKPDESSPSEAEPASESPLASMTPEDRMAAAWLPSGYTWSVLGPNAVANHVSVGMYTGQLLLPGLPGYHLDDKTFIPWKPMHHPTPGGGSWSHAHS